MYFVQKAIKFSKKPVMLYIPFAYIIRPQFCRRMNFRSTLTKIVHLVDSRKRAISTRRQDSRTDFDSPKPILVRVNTENGNGHIQ